jgi:site-specific DNA-methyltransferase (adenine-specific)
MNQEKRRTTLSKSTDLPTLRREIGNATIYRGDCLQLLAQLTEQVDALITDPPYSSGGMHRGDRARSPLAKYIGSQGATAAHNVDFSGDNRDARSWAYWMTMWLSLARAKLRPEGYAMVFTDWRQLPALTDSFQAGGLVWRGLVPWDKTGSARAPHTGYFRHQCEYVVWGSNGSLPKATHGGPWPGLITQRVDHRAKLHMTAKPVEMMEQLVKAVPPDSVILDPFMGSASTGIAALRAGHRFIGFEQDRHYFDVSVQRLEEFVRSQPAD